MLDRESVKNICRLSPMQQGILFHCIYTGDRSLYVEQATYDIRGALDERALEGAWRALVKRHDALRTAIVVKNAPEPLQVVLRERPLDYARVDLSAQPSHEQEAAIERARAEDFRRGFDLARDPLMRVRLFRLGDGRSAMLWSFHHIILDGWCQHILERELGILYASLARGARVDLDRPVPHSAYVRWLEGRDQGAAERYWTGYLEGLSRGSPAPHRAAKEGASGDFKIHQFSLTAEVTRQLSELARRHKATLNTAVQAIWGFVLARANAMTDVVFAAIVSGRDAGPPGVEQVVGVCINAVPVRVRLVPGETFGDLLSRLQREGLASGEHGAYPLAQALSKTGLGKAPPDHILVCENYPQLTAGGAEMSGLTISQRAEMVEKSSYALTVQFFLEASLRFSLRYDPRAFDAGSMERIERDVRDAVTAALEGADGPYDRVTAADGAPFGRPAVEARPPLEVAIAATFTADPLLPHIAFWAAQFGHAVEPRLAPYGQVFQELLDPNSLFSRTAGLRVLLVRLEDWMRDLDRTDEDMLLASATQGAADIEEALRGHRSPAPLLAVVLPPSDAYGLSERVRARLGELTERWTSRVAELPHGHVLDLRGAAERYGVRELHDPAQDRLGHVPFTDAYSAVIAASIGRWIVAWRRPGYKVIVVDCDNTLWGGVCAEEGAGGVRVSGGYADLQRLLRERREQGFLLAICSRNEAADVRRVFDENEGMILGWKDITAHRVNWAPKSQNLRELAAELGLGLDSFIFIDDDPVQCAEVRSSCPEVLTLALPQDNGLFSHFLAHVWALDRVRVSAEDRARSALYDTEKERQTLREGSTTLETFMAALRLEVWLSPPAPRHVARLAQLTQRTNQWNLNTRRRTETEVAGLLEDPRLRVRLIAASDRFGSYGIVGLLVVELDKPRANVETLLLSCRALGRGVEQAVLFGLRAICEAEGVTDITAGYRPTDRNAPIRDALLSAGWEATPSADGVTGYRIARDALPSEPGSATLHVVDPGDFALEKRAPAAPGSAAERAEVEREAGDAERPPAREDRSTGAPRPGDYIAAWSLGPEGLADLRRRADYLPLLSCSGDKLLALPVEPPAGRLRGAEFAAPETLLQARLASIWEGVTGATPVGLDDDFFALGGNSLKAVQLLARAHREIGVELELKDIFDAPTVRALSRRLEGALGGAFAPIPRVPDAQHYRASHAQRRLYVLHRLLDKPAVYNNAGAFLLEGPLDVAAMRRSLGRLVERHEALRTVFHEVGGELRQVVQPSAAVDLHEADLRGEPDPASAARERLARDAEEPFDLGRLPLARAHALRLGEARYVLGLNVHHIVSDGWSFNVLFGELAALYAEESGAAGEARLPALPIQLRDHAEWERRSLGDQAAQSHRAHWLNKLAAPHPKADLPADRPRPPALGHTGAVEPIRLSRALTASLHLLGRGSRASLFMTLLAAVQAFLHRYTGARDILVGGPVAGRSHPDLEHLVGCFVNTLVYRTEVDPGAGFGALLERVRGTVLEASEHQGYPFDVLVEELGVPRRTDRSPLFDVMLVVQDAAAETPGLAEIRAAPFAFQAPTCRFDLTFVFREAGGELHGELVYRADLFSAARARTLADRVVRLLEAVVAEPDQPIGELDLLPQAERRLLLEASAGPPRPASSPRTLWDLFEERALDAPDRAAIVSKEGVVSYGALLERARRLGGFLADEAGLEPGTLVGVAAGRAPDTIAALLGVLEAGCAYLPLDPGYPRERLRAMVADSGCRIALTPAGTRGAVAEIPGVQAYEVERAARSSARRSRGRARAGDLAYVLYTSGSTGDPKGVMIEHAGFVNMILAQVAAFGVTPDDRVLQFASGSFDASLSEIFMALLAGAALVLVDRATIEDPASFLRHVEDQRVTVMTLPPVYLHALGRPAFRGVRALITAGEAADPGDTSYFARRLRCFNAYGPTECSVCVTLHEVDPAAPAGPSVPIGRPIADTEILVLDAADRLAPLGALGEICVAGPGLARGYLGRDAQTAERFVEHPFRSGARIYRTGDLGSWREDGLLEFRGRIDEQVKVRGHRVEPGEVAAALRRHEAVSDAAVVGRQREGATELVAYVVAPSASKATLLRHLEGRLPAPFLPSAIVFLDALPQTPNGKVDRSRLPAPWEAPAVRATAAVAPSTAVEERLAAIWEEILGHPIASAHDGFFDVGGNSLLAIRMIDRARQVFGIALTPSILFTEGTIARLAALIDGGDGGPRARPADVLVPIQPGGGRPPIFCVHPVGGQVLCYEPLARALGGDQPLYGLQSRGLVGADPLDRIEDMAVAYVEAIREVQIHGPYLLLGWSMGGVIAFEMARRLREAGALVAPLLLIDSWIPGADGAGIATSPADRRALFERDTLGNAALDRPDGARPPAEPEPSSLFRAFDVNCSALERYTPSPAPLDALLVRAVANGGEEAVSPRGWSPLILGRLTMADINADHYSIIKEPHVFRLQELLLPYLRR